MPSISRRHVLAAGALAAAGLAGCTRRQDVPDNPILTRISARNLDDEPHPVAVYVEYEGDVKHWQTHELAAASGGEDAATVTLEPPDFPRKQGLWMVGIRRLDADRRHAFAPRVADEKCMQISLLVNEDGSLSHGVTSHDCQSTE